VTEQAGNGFTVTVLSHSLVQPFLETANDNVKEPEVPAFTRTESAVVEPAMVPFPEIDQR